MPWCPTGPGGCRARARRPPAPPTASCGRRPRSHGWNRQPQRTCALVAAVRARSTTVTVPHGASVRPAGARTRAGSLASRAQVSDTDPGADQVTPEDVVVRTPHLAPLVRTDDEGAAGIRRLDAGDLGIRRGPIAPGAPAIGRDRHGSPTGDAGPDGDPPRDVSVDRRHARPQRHDGRLDRHGGRLWRRRGGDRSARRRHRRPRCRLRPRSPRGVEAAGEPQHRPQQEHVDEQEQHQAHVGPAPCSAVASFTP